jgi:mono/diheme cytochrome c family protein
MSTPGSDAGFAYKLRRTPWREVGWMASQSWSKQRWQVILNLCLWLVCVVCLVGCSQRYNAAVLDGQAIFAANCGACHTIGGGNLAGPDLKGVTEQQPQQWLVAFIDNPDQVITSGDPAANQLLREFNYVVMPSMGLTNAQILAVIGYIQAESTLITRPTPVTTPQAQLLPGDPVNGRNIFLGYVHLKNGAPFCIGCHNIDDIGLLGGGTLGPDLTDSYSIYGDAGLEGILSNLPFLTMRPVYANNGFSEQEKADLRAFMKSVSGAPHANKEWEVIGISLAGFLAIMLVFAFAWRKRLSSVRRQLVERSRGRPKLPGA